MNEIYGFIVLPVASGTWSFCSTTHVLFLVCESGHKKCFSQNFETIIDKILRIIGVLAELHPTGTQLHSFCIVLLKEILTSIVLFDLKTFPIHSWYDGFITAYVGDDGRIFKLVIDKVIFLLYLNFDSIHQKNTSILGDAWWEIIIICWLDKRRYITQFMF